MKDIKLTKENRVSVVLRLLLTLGLCVGVYSETGIWTTLAIMLSAFGNELNLWLIKRQKSRVGELEVNPELKDILK